MQTATIEAANWWARPRGAQAREWMATYQGSLQARHRTVLVEIMRALAPTSVLEVGCHCGPNLIRLGEAFPALMASGVDANDEAVAEGQRWAKAKGIEARVELKAGRFPDVTSAVPSGSVDVVFSCYALAYVAPSDLLEALAEVGRLATTAIVLMEPQTDNATADEKRSMSGYNEWAHNYRAALQWVSSVRGWATEIIPITPPVDRLNAALVARRCS
jgi:ubiquinone/menaquinone biosynthesis C-methylase UbiE